MLAIIISVIVFMIFFAVGGMIGVGIFDLIVKILRWKEIKVIENNTYYTITHKLPLFREAVQLDEYNSFINRLNDREDYILFNMPKYAKKEEQAVRYIIKFIKENPELKLYREEFVITKEMKK